MTSDALPPATGGNRLPYNLINSAGVMVLLGLLAFINFMHLGAPSSLSAGLATDVAYANLHAGSDPADMPVTLAAGVAPIIHVPQDFPTIQKAVDHAVSGQIILIAPGVYHESVRVMGAAKSHITLRGMDRNGVILDGNLGGGQYLPNAVVVGLDNKGVPANGVIIENMTARYYLGNGFFWDYVTGYRGSYLNALDNGDYGIYAYESTRGQFDHDFASGSPDSGIYIGGCFPCDALITHVVSENSALGYSGTNAGGNLVIRDSVWRWNSEGILPNTLDSEPGPPQHQVTVIDNLVYSNNNNNVPFKRLEYPATGIGISAPGGVDDLIIHNKIEDQKNYGILVLGNIDTNLWFAHGNTVKDNVVTGSGVADIGLTAPAGPNNCFSGNQVTRTVPAMLQVTNACDQAGGRLPTGDLGPFMLLIYRFIDASSWSESHALALQNRWQTFPLPDAAEQQAVMPNMPGDLTASVQPIFNASWTTGSYHDLGIADPHVTNATKAVAAVPLSSLFEILLGFYSYLLPIALFAAWVGIALWDVARRSEGDTSMSAGARYGWIAAIVGIPLLGAIAYYIFGKSKLTSGFRWMMVGGSFAIWIVMTGLLLFLSTLVG